MPYKDWLEEWICTDRERKTFLTRKEYYTKHIPHANTKDLYDQLVQCPTFSNTESKEKKQ